MDFTVVSLRELLKVYSEEEARVILDTFRSIPNQENDKVNDGESFLYEKAINFEHMGLDDYSFSIYKRRGSDTCRVFFVCK